MLIAKNKGGSMDLIQLATRQYNDLIPDSLRGMDQEELFRRVSTPAVEAWIADYVLPAIDELWKRPIFRENATWSLRTLRPGADG